MEVIQPFLGQNFHVCKVFFKEMRTVPNESFAKRKD